MTYWHALASVEMDQPLALLRLVAEVSYPGKSIEPLIQRLQTLRAEEGRAKAAY